MNNKKSQIIVYDFLFGFLSFIVIITLVSLMWFRTSAQAERYELEKDQLHFATNIANQLIMTSGEPNNWEYDSAIYKDSNFTIGLATDNNILSNKKVEIFFNMNDSNYRGYDETKELLRLQQYNYYIKLRDINNNVNATGKKPLENISVAVTRLVQIGNETKTLEVIIY